MTGTDEAIERERGRTEAWVDAFHLVEERKRLGLTQKRVADLMGVSLGRVSQIENGDLDVAAACNTTDGVPDRRTLAAPT